MRIRQPIIGVLGHVDHGKTSLLDAIRGTSISKKEHGGITQHIGATEIPIDTIYEICGPLIKEKNFKVPGLLFIDTPGHEAFTTLRSRGGSLADIAVLVIDIREKIMPQTIESLNILKNYKTPFVVAATKLDLISGWRNSQNKPFILAIKDQSDLVKNELDRSIYEISEQLFHRGFSAERYDRISDFTKNVAIVPVSSKLNIGIADLLLILIGLAQRYLENELKTEDGPGVGTVLEIKEVKGLGKTLDVILYEGTIKKGDIIVLSGKSKPVVTKVKVLLKPKPLDEIMDPKDPFVQVKEVSAAAGIKISAPDIDDVLPGGTLKVATLETLDRIINEIKNESKLSINLSEDGIVIKADAKGSLEALSYELNLLGVPVKKAEIGDVSKRDIVDAETSPDPLKRIVIAYNVKVPQDLFSDEKVKIIESKVLYEIIDKYKETIEKEKEKIEEEKRGKINYPAKIKVLEDFIFRVSKPAIVGVRVLAGTIKPNLKLMTEDGKSVGEIKSIRDKEQTLKEAIMGQEIAVSISDAIIGKNVKPGDILYSDLTEEDVKNLSETELTYEEKETLNEIISIKRREKPFWGM
ncbi:MAG: translation initiation factor IF-2 [Thermoplasmata archaeon]|nr:translation initiation factor IF-2 [Thermoplasmata archaeon]